LFHSSSPAAAFGGTPFHAFLVAASGIATVLPLIFFGHAARIISLTTLGILQFLGPTLQFIIGWRFYGEPVPPSRLLTFGLIWTAVAIYAFDAKMRERKARI
jgi:chloramphenicol-sensitive protein RarD